jgi:hypothetical protein
MWGTRGPPCEAVADPGSGGIAVRGGATRRRAPEGCPRATNGSGDGEGGKGTRWIGTPAEADVASEVVQDGADGADGARKAAYVGATDGAGSAACVVARGAPVVAAAGTACP